VWLNGELLFGRDEYHRGMQMDQYKMKCHLKQGTECRPREMLPEWAEGAVDGGVGISAPGLR
jgi:hypothetical protein